MNAYLPDLASLDVEEEVVPSQKKIGRTPRDGGLRRLDRQERQLRHRGDAADFEAWLVRQRGRDDDVGSYARAFMVARPKPDSIIERAFGEQARREYATGAADLARASPPTAMRTTSGRQRESRAS